MASKLFNLLADLAKDANLRTKFKADPDGVMSQYGLTDTQKKALKDSMHEGNHDSFHGAIQAETKEHFSNPDVFMC